MLPRRSRPPRAERETSRWCGRGRLLQLGKLGGSIHDSKYGDRRPSRLDQTVQLFLTIQELVVRSSKARGVNPEYLLEQHTRDDRSSVMVSAMEVVAPSPGESGG